MIHRKQIMALDGQETLQEALVQIRDMAYSRYPVYLDDIDNIVGIIHIKDILNQMQEPSVLGKNSLPPLITSSVRLRLSRKHGILMCCSKICSPRRSIW